MQLAVCLSGFMLGFLQVVVAGTSALSSCNVTGEWYTELGSTLHLTANGSGVRGTYLSAVESSSGAAGPNREGKVVGVVGEGPHPTIAFSVRWAEGSCSTWIGQCFVLPEGSRVLKTLWMLRSVAESSSENWHSTRIGEDQFNLRESAWKC